MDRNNRLDAQLRLRSLKPGSCGLRRLNGVSDDLIFGFYLCTTKDTKIIMFL